MSKKGIRIGLVVSLLVGILSLTFSAAAEDNGYWTMKTDESGNQVMIYTYTEPVKWEVNENAGYGDCDAQPTQPIAEVGQADVHYANNTPAASQSTAVSVKKETTNPAGIIVSVIGMFALSLLTAIGIKHRKLLLAKAR